MSAPQTELFRSVNYCNLNWTAEVKVGSWEDDISVLSYTALLPGLSYWTI